ncbi:MAG: hypothetical protein FWG12_03000 [Holophagaceae bacterium]|nr:hypothetical protein [Holophagaceae bacterium]
MSTTTVFAGLGKGSGKTSALCLALSEAQKAGPVGVFTIGFDGDETSAVRVGQGDVVVTTATLARSAQAGLEIIETLPGRSAIGQLCLCRAVRSGAVALVGPEHFGHLVWAIEFVRQKGMANSVLIDGAGARLTQAGALPDCQLVYCARADNANYRRVAEKIDLIAKLADLPLEDGNRQSDNIKCRIDGPLTASILDGLHKDTTHISIETFADCFLDAVSFKRASQRYKIMVRRQIPLLGFVVALKNVRPEIFSAAAPSASSRIAFNPFENQELR